MLFNLLLFFVVLAIASAVAIAGIVRAKQTGHVRHVGRGCLMAIVAVIVSFGLYAVLLSLGDASVKHPVPDSDLTAAYYLERPDTRERLTRMGYVDLTGSIRLKRDGSFEAQNIPACCVFGKAGSVYPFSGSYYQLKGSWENTVSHRSDRHAVRLTIRNASRISANGQAKSGASQESSPPYSEIELPLVAGKPIAIAFRVFIGGDFDDIVFSREGVVPVNH